MSTPITPALFRTTLAQPLNINGNDTEIYVTGLTTLTGETIAFSDFSPFTRGILTVDPDVTNSTQPELISFTGIDSSGVGFTGAKRGLSAVADVQITANQVYHPAGTPVILGFGGYNIEDMLAYFNSLLPGTFGNSSVTNAGITKSTGAFGLATSPRARHAYVSQSGTGGGNTLIVNTIALPTSTGTVIFPQTTTATYTADTVHDRIDLLCYNITSAGLTYRTGTPALTPTTPSPAAGDCVVCSIYHRHTSGSTIILEQDNGTNSYIQAWFEPDEYNPSTNLTSANTTFGVDQSDTASSSTTQGFGENNATTKPNVLAQSFIPTVTSIQGASFWKIADTGTFTGTVKISLQADATGSPSGTDVASYTISNAIWLDIVAAQKFTVYFNTPYTSMIVGARYWLVLTASTSDNSNHPNIGADSSGNTNYPSGALRYNNTADGWVTVTNTDAYFESLCGTVSRTVETDTSGLVSRYVSRYALLTATKPATSVSNTGVVDSYSVPGGILGLNGGLRIKLYLTIASDVGSNSATFQVNINGTTVASTSIACQSGATTILSPILEVKFININATNVQAVYIDSNLTSTGNKLMYPLSSFTTESLDTTEPLNISINVSAVNIPSPGGNDFVTYNGMIIEKLA